MRAEEAYVIAKKYTDDSMQGAGAVAGKPCQIQSIDSITGGNRITFLWVDNSGTSHTSTMDVMNGADGAQGETGATGADGLGIKSVNVDASDHLIITYDDDTTQDAGQIQITAAVDSVNGKTGAVTLDASDVGALADDTPLFSGDYDDLTNKPSLFSGDYDDLSNKPELFSGDYDDLDNKPSIPSKTSELTNDSSFVDTTAMNTAISTSVEEVVEQVYADNGVLGAKNFNDGASEFTFVKSTARTTLFHIDKNLNVGDKISVVFNISDVSGFVTPRHKFGVRIGANPTLSETIPFDDLTQSKVRLEYTITSSSQKTDINNAIYMYIGNEEDASATLKVSDVMVILASDPDSTYVPYAMTNRELTEELLNPIQSAATNILSTAATPTVNRIEKIGKIVSFDIEVVVHSATAWGDPLCNIPAGFRPKNRIDNFASFGGVPSILVVDSYGNISIGAAITSDTTIRYHATWITS